MQTHLPDLPFANYGDAELRPLGTHSTATTTQGKHSRTDLMTLRPWGSFPDDIDQAVQSATTNAQLAPIPFNLDISTRTRFVENEDKICTHATVALHEGVEQVLGMLGVNGWFSLSGGAIIGDPDFSWIMSLTQPHPKVVVCVSVSTCHVFVKSCWLV